MKTTQRNFAGLMALALLITLAPVSQANATVRIRASVNTPHFSVRVNPRPVVKRYRHIERHRHHDRRSDCRFDRVYHPTKKDRKMAKRLARYTGYRKGELLDMRREGYTWREIGRYLNLRPQVVRAARSGKAWSRFMRGHDDHRRVCWDD